MKQPIGIYIHWPYCLSKCPYCDFFSEVKHADEDKIINNYLDDLNFYHNLTLNKSVTSVFFGGGTPSLIKPSNIEKLTTHIHQKWKTTSNIEITLEANPNTHKDNLFQDLKSAGINRLSLGVQALNDQALKFLGRTHTLVQAQKSIDNVLKTFSNHSMDLIYARPNQQLQSWHQELKQASSYGFKHLSLYQLTIEEGTPFYKQGIETLEDDQALELYNFTETFLKEKNYNKYEVSNYSLPGSESLHNLGYWQGRDYIGIGPSAHGRITMQATLHPCIIEPLTPQERATELLLMGLRLTTGINKKTFQSQCGLDINNFINQSNLTKLKTQNLIKETSTHLKATSQGLSLLNKIIEQLIDN